MFRKCTYFLRLHMWHPCAWNVICPAQIPLKSCSRKYNSYSSVPSSLTLIPTGVDTLQLAILPKWEAHSQLQAPIGRLLSGTPLNLLGLFCCYILTFSCWLCLPLKYWTAGKLDHTLFQPPLVRSAWWPCFLSLLAILLHVLHVAYAHLWLNSQCSFPMYWNSMKVH